MSSEPVFAPLIPELLCSKIKASLDFYVDSLGFKILYQRAEKGFAMIEREGAQIMLDEWRSGDKRSWIAAPLEPPFGRGMNLEIGTDDVKGLYARLVAKGVKMFLPLEERWYRADAVDLGVCQFIVQDPDGYLLRFSGRIGTRPSQEV